MRRQLTAGIARLWRGAHWSKEYGEHPGTVPLIMMIAAGCVAGADRHPAWGPFLGGGRPCSDRYGSSAAGTAVIGERTRCARGKPGGE